MKLSRKYSVSDYTRLAFEASPDWAVAADILADRLETRYLAHVRALLRATTSGFAALTLDCALVETLEQFWRGKRKTPQGDGKKYFQSFLTRAPFSRHFNADTAGVFYETIRCGLLHQAEAERSSRIKRGDRHPLVQPVNEGKGVIINAEAFHALLEQAIGEYLALIKDGTDSERRLRFRKKMNFICRCEAPTGP